MAKRDTIRGVPCRRISYTEPKTLDAERSAVRRSNLAQQRCIIVAANYPCFCTRVTRMGIEKQRCNDSADFYSRRFLDSVAKEQSLININSLCISFIILLARSFFG